MTAASHPISASASTSSSSRIPPAATTAMPLAHTFRYSARSGPRIVPSRSMAVTCRRTTPASVQRDSASSTSSPLVAVQPRTAMRPSATSSATSSCSPKVRAKCLSASSLSHAAVPTMTRDAPASSAARAASIERIPPETCRGIPSATAAQRRTTSLRNAPSRAP